MSVTHYGGEIAALVGLISIAVFLWRLFAGMGKVLRVVMELPPKVDATSAKVDTVDRKVDLMTAEHLATKEQLNTGIRDLKGAHEQFDVRLRGVEQNVAIRKDREENPRA